MVLMNFTVDGGLGLFVTLLDHLLLHDCRGNLLMNGGVMVTSFVPKKGILAKTHSRPSMQIEGHKQDGRTPSLRPCRRAQVERRTGKK